MAQLNYTLAQINTAIGSVANKADTSYVDAQLAAKATPTYVDNKVASAISEAGIQVVTPQNSFYTRGGGGFTTVNGGAPVILDWLHVSSGVELGGATVLNNYMILTDDIAGVTFFKLLGGFSVVGQDGMFHWRPGLYVPKLKIYLAGNDYFTVGWRLP
jgi:hypothetical protein